MLGTCDCPALLIRGGRIIDPTTGRDEVGDIAVVAGRIAESASREATLLDATGLIVCPGLMDLHVHLREPGQSHKETIATGTTAAAAGGFTFVACMPNTSPPLDEPERIRWVIEQARSAGWCEVGPVAAITRRREGKELTDFSALLAAGAVAFSDDGTGVEDDDVMRLAFERAHELGALLIQHCEFRSISAGGVMHLGKVSRRLGFPGLDPRSEEAMIERDIDLCRKTPARYHVAHISTAKAVQLVRRAKAEGLPVTTEVCPHHLMLTDEACRDGDPNTKMHPPLRTREDVEACRLGLLDGTIDGIASDHAPHASEEKGAGFLKAPAGIVGLETAIGVAAKAMSEPLDAPPAKGRLTGAVDWQQLIRWFTTGPAKVLHRPTPALQPGAQADLTLINPNADWSVDATQFHSKSRNTPFDGWTLPARAVATIRGRHVTGDPWKKASG